MIFSQHAPQDDEAALPPRPRPLNNVTIALILSLSVCYRARLQDREPYEEHIAVCFNNPLVLHGGDERFRDEIRWSAWLMPVLNAVLKDLVRANGGIR